MSCDARCYFNLYIDRICENQEPLNPPGTAMVHSSHRKVSLGSDGMPTPAMLAARTWNWYFMFSFSSDT